MTWDGVERRNLQFCEEHLGIAKSVAVIEKTVVDLDKRINGSLKSIEQHMDQGIKWRVAIMGVAGLLFVQFVYFVIASAKLGKQVEINTGVICEIRGEMDRLHPRITNERTP